MAHPYAEHRQHKVEHSRVGPITKGYAAGGAVHADASADAALIKKSVKKSALKVDGKHASHRADRPHRARGGRAHKGGKTVVNVIAGGQHPGMMAPPPGGPPAGAPPMPPPMAPPMAAPAMPPRPPMMPPMGGAPGMPPGMPPRHAGGRTYKAGGRVADGPAWKEGTRNGTQVQHTDGKGDGKNIGRGKVVTFRTGGAVESSKGVAKATKLPGGSGGGEARLAKEKRAAKDYARA